MNTNISKKKFINLLTETIELIVNNTKTHKNYKELKHKFKNYYNYYSNENNDFIKFIGKFNENIMKYGNSIAICDDSMFSDDMNEDSVKLYLDLDLDFKIFWKYLTDNIRRELWIKIKNLYTLSIFILKSYKEYNDLMVKQEKIMESLTESIKSENKIKEELKILYEKEELENSINFDDLKKKFGNGIFTDLIIEIVKELNLDKSNGIENLMSMLKTFDINNNDNVMLKITEKIKLKMQVLNITEEQIINEFNNLKQKFEGIFNEIPILKDLMDKISSMVKNVHQDSGNTNTETESFFNELRETVTKLSSL